MPSKKKTKMGRPKKSEKPEKLTLYVLKRTTKAIRRAMKTFPPKPKPTKGMVVDQWADERMTAVKLKSVAAATIEETGIDVHELSVKLQKGRKHRPSKS